MLLEVHQLYLYIYMHLFIKKNTQFIKKKKKRMASELMAVTC